MPIVQECNPSEEEETDPELSEGDTSSFDDHNDDDDDHNDRDDRDDHDDHKKWV